MHIAELLLLNCLIASAAIYGFRPRSTVITQRSLLWISMLLLSGILFWLGIRWQLIPALLALIMLGIGCRWFSKAKLRWRVPGTFTAVLLISTSAFLCMQFPMISLPAPTGPSAVGNFEHSFTDNGRVETYQPEHNRELYLNIWYPADSSEIDSFRTLTLWEELYSEGVDWISIITSYLKSIPTHSHRGASIASEGKYPVLIFNHGMFMFTTQNLLLMEELASHGYVVVSIGHTYNSLKVNLDQSGTILVRALSSWPPEIRRGAPAPAPDIVRKGLTELVGTPVSQRYLALQLLIDEYRLTQEESERRELVQEANEHSEALGLAPDYPDEFLYNYLENALESTSDEMVQYWVEDIESVIEYLNEISAPVSGFNESLDFSKIGVIGMSFGGAAAGEFCKQDSRCKAGSNLDGFQFGRNWNVSLKAPFLLVYSEELRGNTDFAYLNSTEQIQIVSIKGTTHADLTDLPHVARILKLLGISGEIDNSRASEIINHLHLKFFNHHLKGEPLDASYFSKFNEIQMRTLHQ